MTIEAMKQALEALETCMYPQQKQIQAITALRQAIEQAEKQEPVAELTDDEIHDAAYATFCRGPNTRELFRMMWTCNPPCSIGWDRNELKAFARHIASLYTTPPPRQPLTDEEILAVARDHYNPHQRPEISFARSIEAAHGIKEKNT